MISFYGAIHMGGWYLVLWGTIKHPLSTLNIDFIEKILCLHFSLW